LNRWQQELRHHGGKAFSGYGKSRAPIKPRTQNIIFRLTEDEFNEVKAASSAVGSRSLSDFVRSQVLGAIGEPSPVQVDKKLGELSLALQQIMQIITKT
jgi:hypothetical protein